MINQAITAIITRLNDYIGTAAPDVLLGNISLLEVTSEVDGASLSDRVVASVVNIQQEKSMRNLPAKRSSLGTDGTPEVVKKETGLRSEARREGEEGGSTGKRR